MIINIHRIKRIDKLISLKATGTPKELSETLGISKRQIHNDLLKMKELGAPIKYCEIHKSYVYTEPVSFECDFTKN